MKSNTNLCKAIRIFPAFLISILHLAGAIETKKDDEPPKSKGAITPQIRERINQVLKEFNHNMEEYYRRTRTSQVIIPKKITDYNPEELKIDRLTHYDYSSLHIPLLKSDKGLTIRKDPLNITGRLQEKYKLGGRTFRRQNVKGTGLRCFFNAAGLIAEEEIQKLKANGNNPIVRYMIANEILSATANPEQLPATVKKAINFELYKEERQQLNELYELRSSLLREQNSDANQQDPSQLPLEYQQQALTRKEQKIQEDLRMRATSLDAFNAFLNDHIGGVNMMVSLHEVTGEAGDNVNADYTSIDAIVYSNDCGIKIFQPITGYMLYFIPDNMEVDADHTPALKKIKSMYKLFVRTRSGGVSQPLDPVDLGIKVKDLDQLWKKKLWGNKTNYQTQFLKYDHKIMKNIIKNGNHHSPGGDGLNLVHEFIPQNATQIAYVYHEPGHFQALIPE